MLGKLIISDYIFSIFITIFFFFGETVYNFNWVGFILAQYYEGLLEGDEKRKKKSKTQLNFFILKIIQLHHYNFRGLLFCSCNGSLGTLYKFWNRWGPRITPKWPKPRVSPKLKSLLL